MPTSAPILRLAAWFKTIGGTAFNFMLPVLAGFIAMAIADRPGLMVGFVGGCAGGVRRNLRQLPPEDAVRRAGFLGALIAGFAGGLSDAGHAQAVR